MILELPLPVAILAENRTPQDTRLPSTVSHNQAHAIDQNVNHDAACVAVRVARQFELQPNRQHHVLGTMKSHGLITIKPGAIWISRHHTLVARGIMDISPT